MIDPDRLIENLPGRNPLVRHRSPLVLAGAAAAAICWPPLVLTLLIWPPLNWVPDTDTDFRLILLVVALFAVPIAMWRLQARSEQRTEPLTRQGIICRFAYGGGLVGAVGQTALAVISVVTGWIESQSLMQAAGSTETNLLIYGVLGLPVTILVGVSHALWAGFCVALIAYRSSPEVSDRLGLIPRPDMASTSQVRPIARRITGN